MFIPVPMKVKYLLPIVVVISVYLGVSGNGGGIAHLAHVGGALVGWLWQEIGKSICIDSIKTFVKIFGLYFILHTGILFLLGIC
jgi:hypothetical protein